MPLAVCKNKLFIRCKDASILTSPNQLINRCNQILKSSWNLNCLGLFIGRPKLSWDPSFSPTHVHDAGVAPWPIASGSYDLVLGLQCWEHFRGRQAEAFREAMRVAGPEGHVLLSVPFMWRRTNATHAGIGVSRIREWTLGVEPERRLLVKKPEARKRMVLLFRGGEVRPQSEEKPHSDDSVQGR